MTTLQLVFLLPLAGLVLSMLFLRRGGHGATGSHGSGGCCGGHAHHGTTPAHSHADDARAASRREPERES